MTAEISQRDRLVHSRRILGRAIEESWLAAIVLVPLTFGPPSWFTVSDVAKVAVMRVLAAAIAGMALTDMALALASEPSLRVGAWRARLRAWLASYPPRGVILLAIGLLTVVATSAVLSPFDAVATRGFEEGRDGYSLISFASVVVVFLAIAYRARTPSTIDRLLRAIATATVLTSLYGIAQTVGVAPWGLDALNASRVVGSFGNPIFFGAFLVMGLPITMYVCVGIVQGRSARLGVPLAAVGLAIPSTALALTLARGPWVGAAVATVIFVVAAALLLPPALRRRYAATLAGATVLTLVLLSVIQLPGSHSWALGTTLDRAGSVPGSTANGISGRLNIWRDAIDISLDRPWFAPDQTTPTNVVIHTLGYGPDSFVYVYPLGDTHEPSDSLILTKNAHNWFVHSWVELGLLGLLLSSAVLLLPLAACGWLLLRGSPRSDWPQRLLLAGLFAALTGRAVEQMGGVAQVSDSLVHWAILGVLIAIGAPKILSRVQPTRGSVLAIALALAVGLAGAGILASLVWTSAIRPVLADLNANRAQDSLALGDDARAFDLLLDAVERAPSVDAYRASVVNMLTVTRISGISLDARLQITESTVALLREAVAVNPYDASTNALLGVELLMRSELMGTSSGEAIEAFQRTVTLLPDRWQAKRALGAALFRVGRPADAIPVLTEAFAAARGTAGAAVVLHLRAKSYLARGQHGEARADLLEALELTNDAAVLRQIRSTLNLVEP
ncbi:MAG: O-antigen ligase family protein [Chloroflexi bacterium]|nr:O-antigen ligase family protein [Chloroflexota bacterium]